MATQNTLPPEKDIPDLATEKELETDYSQAPSQARTPSLRAEDAVQEPVGDSKEAVPNEDDEIVYPSTWKMIIIVLALDLAVLLVALDQTIIATAIPKITDRFKSLDDVGWYGSAYFLTSTALQPSFGRIYKNFNVRLRVSFTNFCH
jgi:hypothetical protein